MKENFLTREIQRDSKNLYVSCNGYRLRPIEESEFKVGTIISMIQLGYGYDGVWCIFSNSAWYETWQWRKP